MIRKDDIIDTILRDIDSKYMYIFIVYVDRQILPVTREGLQEEKLHLEECVREVLQEKESEERLIHGLKRKFFNICI